MDQWCKKKFQEIAEILKGKCLRVKLEGDKAREIFTSFILKQFLVVLIKSLKIHMNRLHHIEKNSKRVIYVKNIK